MRNDNPQTKSLYQANLRHSLVAGAMAGTIVDSVLFPLGNSLKQPTKNPLLITFIDTIKTRLQTQAGFAVSGGFRGVYSGLLSAFVGSAPNGNQRKKKKS